MTDIQFVSLAESLKMLAAAIERLAPDEFRPGAQRVADAARKFWHEIGGLRNCVESPPGTSRTVPVDVARLRSRRLALGLSQEGLAMRMQDYSNTIVADIERRGGIAHVFRATRRALATALECSEEDLAPDGDNS